MAEPTSLVGERYQLFEQLGRGGMAVVHRAFDTSKGVMLALKQAVLQHDPTRDRELRALFESEFHTLSQLKHPSVITVYDFGIDATGPFYTMELLEGGDLTAGLPLPYRRACTLLMQISSALALLHARGLLHRDITPRNVRCIGEDRAKLIDFGAMTAIGPCTRVVGTPAFMAPEVANSMTLDARSDLFGLGATLYYALTGRFAYAARSVFDLRHAWQIEPTPPSAIVPDIPAALDALTLSLLAIDPQRRPRNAFEVMQRLAAIAGVQELDTSAISQAYLATPVLVGRDIELQMFRVHMQQALSGRGGGMLFESAFGAGRTRMLDACVLEAKTLGAIVLRMRGGGAESAAFAGAHELAVQLCEALPRDAWQSAREAGALSVLFEAGAGGESAPALSPLTAWRSERFALQTALANWLRRVSVEHPLLITVDDSERVDEASLALIAALAHAAKSERMAIVAMVTRGEPALGALSLNLLREHSQQLSLRALTAAESEALFASVFANAPNVPLLNDRIYRVAAGSPRDSMALAQHLLDRRVVRFVDGVFRLPSALELSDLPANIEAAVLNQLASLSPLALSLVQTQALSIGGSWSRADYAEIAGASVSHLVDEAINRLLRLAVVVNMGGVYALKHHGLRDHLLAQLSEDQLAARHVRLADLCARSGRSPLLEIYHAFLGGDAERGLAKTALLLDQLAGGALIIEQHAVEPKWIVMTLECAFQYANSTGRPVRELCELARHLTGLSIPTETRLFYQYGERLLLQLTKDSGLDDYRASDPQLPAADRLKAAADNALARYAATPEAARVYPLFDAIKYLAQHVSNGIVVGSRRCDTRLLAALPSMLEPFEALSPALHALWQNTIAACEINYLALPEQGRGRLLDVYARLVVISAHDLPVVDTIRNSVAYALGVMEASLGYATAHEWIEIMQAHPLHQVNAMYLRHILAIYAGDLEAAGRFRSQAEVLAVQASSRQMFDVQMVLELAAHAHARDLTAVKHTADRIEQFALEQPRWQAFKHVANSFYERLRGDLGAAKEHCVRALALCDPAIADPPANMNAWVNAAGSYVTVLNELGEAAQARAFAEQARAVCLSRGLVMSGWAAHIERGLALAEAKQGDYAAARARLDRLIEARTGLVTSRRALDYQARVRVAIWEGDSAATRHYVSLAMGHSQLGVNAMPTTLARLLDEARQAGLDVQLPKTGFETSVIGSQRPRNDLVSKVVARLQAAPDRASRVRRALELLCEATAAPSGHLFLARGLDLTCEASLGETAGAAVTAYAAGCWHEQIGQVDLDLLTTGDLDADQLTGHSMGGGGSRFFTQDGEFTYRVAPLRSNAADATRPVGLVLLAIPGGSEIPSSYWAVCNAILASLRLHRDV